MKILLTGASSFTGYWFAHALAGAGHHVVAPLKCARTAYVDGTRAERVRRLDAVAEVVEETRFGDGRFLALASGGGFGLLCHHAAHVGDHRSADFDIVAALAENTLHLRSILAAMIAGGLKGVVLTGSVFEQNEGAGNAPLVAFSPYGLSKGLTAAVFEHWCREAGVPLGKFVIPNPFGPLEEPRFGTYLVRTWIKGEVAGVNTPAYIRDNIHVGLLADAYVRFAEATAGGPLFARLNPSGYVESQGAFAERFAAEMRPRLGLECGLRLARQTDFPEPLMRVNTDPAWVYAPHWDEAAAWDQIAAHARTIT